MFCKTLGQKLNVNNIINSVAVRRTYSASTNMFLRNLVPRVARLNVNNVNSSLNNVAVRRPYSSSSEVKTLRRGEHGIAYKVVTGKNPGIIFCPGFQSNMMGVKASALEKYCERNKLAYVRFDYRGCGQSTGNLREATLTDWRNDLLSIIDNVTAGPQIIVGSSIGGLLMLEAAEMRPNRIHSLVGIAIAGDIGERTIEDYPEDVQEQLKDKDVAEWTMDGHNYVLTKQFLDNAKKNHNILNRNPESGNNDDTGIRITHPVRLLHGMEDAAIPYQVSLRIAQALWSNDVNVTFGKLADHRFSQPEDIQLLFEMLDYLIYGADEARKLAIQSWSSFTVYQHQKGIKKEKVQGKTI